MRARLLAAFVLTGCVDDATVRVDFDVPAAYESTVTNVAFSLLVPSPLEPFDCEGIAWGSVDDERIDASRTMETRTRRGNEVPISGIPRLGQKIFLAEGFDAEGVPIVADCADLGDIEGDVTVELVGEPVPQVILQPFGLGEPLPSEVRVVVNDARGGVLGGVPIRWTVTGPAGEVIAGPDGLATDSRGLLTVNPTAPTRPGPNALDLAVRWSRPPPDSILGYVEPEVAFEGTLPGTFDERDQVVIEAIYAVGRFGPAGQGGFVALGPRSSVGERQAVLAWWNGTAFQMVTSGAIVGAQSVGRLRGPMRDQAVSLTMANWIEIRPDGSTPVVAPSTQARAARRLASIGPCTDGPVGDRLLAWFGDGFAAYDDSFQEVTTPLTGGVDPAWRLIASGCVAGPTDPVRAVVYSQGQFLQQIVAQMDVARTGPWLALPVGVGFLPSIGGEDPLLLGSTLTIDGASVARMRLSPSTGDRLLADLVTEDESTSFAISTTGGDVDGDGRGDVVSVLTFGESDTLVPGVNFRLLVSLGVPHRGGRLIGLSGALVARNPAVFLHDFDDDGTDDALIASTTNFVVALLGR